jgi:hypothetical protein
MVVETLTVIIDLEKDRMAVRLERAKVVFFMGVQPRSGRNLRGFGSVEGFRTEKRHDLFLSRMNLEGTRCELAHTSCMHRHADSGAVLAVIRGSGGRNTHNLLAGRRAAAAGFWGTAAQPCNVTTKRRRAWRLNKKTEPSRKSYLEGVVEFESRIIHK